MGSWFGHKIFSIAFSPDGLSLFLPAPWALLPDSPGMQRNVELYIFRPTVQCNIIVNQWYDLHTCVCVCMRSVSSDMTSILGNLNFAYGRQTAWAIANEIGTYNTKPFESELCETPAMTSYTPKHSQSFTLANVTTNEHSDIGVHCILACREQATHTAHKCWIHLSQTVGVNTQRWLCQPIFWSCPEPTNRYKRMRFVCFRVCCFLCFARLFVLSLSTLSISLSPLVRSSRVLIKIIFFLSYLIRLSSVFIWNIHAGKMF